MRESDNHLELVQKFPLKPIRSDEQLRQAHLIIDEITKIPEEKLTRDQSDYLEVLGDLTLAYEDRIMSSETAAVTGLDVLNHLMDANDLSASDLGRMQRRLASILGCRPRRFCGDNDGPLGCGKR